MIDTTDGRKDKQKADKANDKDDGEKNEDESEPQAPVVKFEPDTDIQRLLFVKDELNRHATSSFEREDEE